MDKCGGYASNNGVYKYHITPVCLLQQLTAQYTPTTTGGISVPAVPAGTVNNPQHSPQLGWALDGFPVFGPIGAKGVEMKPCSAPGAHKILCLDSCNGYYGKLPGYDQYMYRYYFTGEVATGQCSSSVTNAGTCTREDSKCCASTVPSVPYRPFSIGCFRGCPLYSTDNPYTRPNSDPNVDPITYMHTDFDPMIPLGGSNRCKLGDTRGTTPDFIPKLSNFATVVNGVTNLVTTAANESTVPIREYTAGWTGIKTITALFDSFF